MDTDTFITTLYVMADDFCKELKVNVRPGPKASLSSAEVTTLAIFGQWWVFSSEQSFYRWARRHLRGAFPTLPDRAQFNRLVRQHYQVIAWFSLYLVKMMDAKQCPYEILDAFGVSTRHFRRYGRGWMPGQADTGWCGRLGLYFGFYVLDAINPEGVITGHGFGPASGKEQTITDDFLAARNQPEMLASAGTAALGGYLTDTGFEGKECHRRWLEYYGAKVITPPKSGCKDAWPHKLRSWFSGLRQIVESVHDKLLNVFRLSRERSHNITGFQARLAAKVALHNFCIWINKQLGRPNLAFADLIDW